MITGNPLAADPTRLGLTRRKFQAGLRRRYALFRQGIPDRLPDLTTNVFCPTGKGGGVDPTCKPGGGPRLGRLSGMPSATYRKVKDVSNKLKKKLVDRYGVRKATAIVVAAQTTAWASAAAAPFVGLPGVWVPSMAAALPYIGLAEIHRQLTRRPSLVTNDPDDDDDLTPEELEEAVRELIRELEEELGTDGPPTDNSLVSDAAVDQLIGRTLLGGAAHTEWTDYTREGFLRGVGRAYDDTPDGPEDRLPGVTDPVVNAAAGQIRKQVFVAGTLGRKEVADKVRMLSDRAFAEMVNLGGDTANLVKRAVADGILRGKSAKSIAKDIEAVADLSEQRAYRIARTELTRAHAEGQLDAFEQMGVSELTAKVEWKARAGACPRCERMNGAIYTVANARGVIPLHPHCLCAWVPAPKGARATKRRPK